MIYGIHLDALWITLVLMVISWLAGFGAGVLADSASWQRAARRGFKRSGGKLYRIEVKE